MIKKIFQTTIVKIIVGFIAIITLYELTFGLLNYLLRLGPIPQVIRLIAIPIIISTLIIITYIALCRYYEKRKATELSTLNIGKYLVFGLLIGLFLPSLSIFIAYLRGGYIVLSFSDLTSIFLRDLSISIAFGILTAVYEEVLFRGFLFRLIEEKLGSYFALIFSGVLFGFLHLMNDSSALFAAVAISVISIVITATYIYTRNLWFPIAFHFAFNFAQGDIFGTPVSGEPVSTSIMISQLEGSKWFTGGTWGIEAAVQTVIICLITGVILLVFCHKKGHVMKRQIFRVQRNEKLQN